MNFINRLITKSPEISIVLENADNKFITIKGENGTDMNLPIYNDWDPIRGKIIINLNRNKNFHHQGIKIELFGVIESSNRKKSITKFLSICKDLESANEINSETSQYDFDFIKVEKPHDSYQGIMNSVKYILRATLMTGYKSIECDQEIIVQKQYFTFSGDNELINPPIEIDVGIEEWIHVKFFVDRSRFFLKDCIEGQVKFKIVSVKFSSMELQIIRKETVGIGMLIN